MADKETTLTEDDVANPFTGIHEASSTSELDSMGIVPGPKLEPLFPEDIKEAAPVEETPAEVSDEPPTEVEEAGEAGGEEQATSTGVDDETPSPTSEGKTLTDEDLENMHLNFKVDGVEETKSLKEIRDNYQIALGADKRLEDAAASKSQYNEEVNKLRELQNQLLTAANKPTPEPYADPNLSYIDSDPNTEIAQLRQEFASVRQQLANAETGRLASEEDAIITNLVRESLGTDDMTQVSQLAKRVIANDPDFEQVASLIFDGSAPKDHQDMTRRIAFFKTFLIQAKHLELPTIVEEAKAEGKIEEKKARKQKLATVDSTAPPPTESSSEKIRKARESEAVTGRSDGFAKIAENTFINSLFPELD